MTAMRIASLIAWSILFAAMVPSLFSILRGCARTGDPVRLVFAAFAVVVIGFNLKWLLLPESVIAQAALHLLSGAVAILAIFTARSYGRGAHV